jgi:hypothetical protein
MEEESRPVGNVWKGEVLEAEAVVGGTKYIGFESWGFWIWAGVERRLFAWGSGKGAHRYRPSLPHQEREIKACVGRQTFLFLRAMRRKKVRNGDSPRPMNEISFSLPWDKNF